VHAITDFQPSVGDDGIDLFCRSRGVSVSRETAIEAASNNGDCNDTGLRSGVP